MTDMISLELFFNREIVKVLLLVVSIIIIFLIVLVSNRGSYRALDEIQKDLIDIKKNFEVQGTYLSQLNDHFTVVDQKLKNLEEITSNTSRDISSMAEGISGEVGVGKAIELARRGATVDEILQGSNLRKDQAELIVKFHGAKN